MDITIDPQILAIVIFGFTYLLIISNFIHRTIAALLGSLLIFATGVLSGEQIVRSINWEALGLIFGMFILVGALRESGFFRWIGLKTLKITKFNTIKIFLLFSILAAILAAFMDSITVLLFMSSLTIEACHMLRIKPQPFIISEICSANIGGSATMVGDPPNIIIGTSCNFSFSDFVVNTGPIAVAVFIVNIFFFYMWYKKDLKVNNIDDKSELERLDPKEAIRDRRLMIAGIVAFLITVILLIIHNLLGMSVAYVGFIGATIILLIGGSKMPKVIEKVDWLTLIFFAGLFVIVGGVEETKVLNAIALSISNINGKILIVMAIIWVSAFLSAFVDNVPFSATMVPVIKNLAPTAGIPLPTLAWALSLGTDIGGNATPIGASANVVGVAIAEKSGYRISWEYYLKIGFPSMIISITISTILIYIRYML